MEFMYEYSAAHKFFLYLNSTATTSEATTSLVPPPPPPLLEAYDQAYYPTSSINDQELMMNFKATDDHIHPPPPRPLAEAAAPFTPYNQVQFSDGSSMLMDFSCIEDINEDICSNSSYCFETSREAKVLRYKEKKRRRNYTKKIRYPSRKAYADRRPRIRGRFIKVLEEDEQPPIALNQYNQESPMDEQPYNTESVQTRISNGRATPHSTDSVQPRISNGFVSVHQKLSLMINNSP